MDKPRGQTQLNPGDACDDEVHSLLDPPTPTYSKSTLRRAFLVWMYLGQHNEFKKVCDFYHYLEAHENTLPPERLVESHEQELQLVTSGPPTSEYLKDTFRNIYSCLVSPKYIKKLEDIYMDKFCFQSKEHSESKNERDLSKQEIFALSDTIRRHCRSNMITRKKFFKDFKQFAIRSEQRCTIINMEKYIYVKNIEAELNMHKNIPTTFSFLEPSPMELTPELLMLKPSQIKPKQTKLKPIKSRQMKSTPILPNPAINIQTLFKFDQQEDYTNEKKDSKLNPVCAAFFNYFSEKYSCNDKNVALTSLNNLNKLNNLNTVPAFLQSLLQYSKEIDAVSAFETIQDIQVYNGGIKPKSQNLNGYAFVC